jgi:hypothetical protein
MRTNVKLVWLVIVSGVAHDHGTAQENDFTYQGFLNRNGSAVSGYYDFQFGVYDAATNGTLKGGLVTNTAVVVSNGVFTTAIDFGPQIFKGQSLWLDTAVSTNGANTFDSLRPRQKLTPVPYALYSPVAGKADTAGSVLPGGVSVSQLNTVGAPGTGQVLGYNGTQLVWQDPAVGGATGGWSLNGNQGTTPSLNFIGTIDNQPLEVRVGGARALRLEPDLTKIGAPNVIGGSPANSVSNSVVGATIAGGGAIAVSGTSYSNRVTSAFGTIGGGVRNLAANQFTTVAGGFQNAATGYISTIAGGAYNIASDNEAFVGGGAYNSAGLYSVVAGGDDNTASGVDSVVVGGLANTASGQYSFVGGGTDVDSPEGSGPVGNIASGDFSVVVGGNSNHATTDFSTVGGGEGNTASGAWSTVTGGALNEASGVASFAGGYNAHATTAGSFVWADNSSASPFTTSANYQFLVRAINGMGVGTTQTPPGGLRVDSGGLAVTGASSPHYGTAQGVFLEKFGTGGAVYAFNYSSMTPSSLLLNSPGGNVGIGTLNPQKTLEVNGSVSAHTLDVNGGVTAHGLSLVGGSDVVGPVLDVNGTTRTHALTITGGADLAEPFKMANAELPKGSVVVIDDHHPGELKISTQEYDTKVVGIVSGANGINPGIALHQQGLLEGGQNVALSGRVYVRADASFGAIKPGDLLTTCRTPGHAMKASDRAKAQGSILGKAMTGLGQGQGMVLVVVTLQ